MQAQTEQEHTAQREVPLDLTPEFFEKRIGGLRNGDEPSEILGTAHRAFEKLHRSLSEVYQRERTIKADPTRTEADQRMRVSRVARAAKEPVAEAVVSALEKVTNHIGYLDNHIAEGLKSAMPLAEAQEIRGHVRNLSPDERNAFLSKADAETLSAVLASKPFLSGMNDAEAKMIRDRMVRENFPGLLELRTRLEKAQDGLESGARLFEKKLDPLIASDAKRIEGAAEAADNAAKQPLSL